MFVTLDDTKKNGPKTFVIARTAFFEMFDSINLLSPKEMILSFAQKGEITLWTLINCLLTIFVFDVKRKKQAKLYFFSVERLPFLENFLFSTTS